MPVNISLLPFRHGARLRFVGEADVVTQTRDVDELPSARVAHRRRARGRERRATRVGAEQRGRDVHEQPVDEPRFHERARDLRAAFEHRLEHTETRERLERRREVDTPAVRGGGGSVSTLAPAASHAFAASSGAASW